MPTRKKRSKKTSTPRPALTYEKARARYRPERVKALFVAEAPPADPSRFFYFENVGRDDWLFLGLIRWHYEEARELDVHELRDQKAHFLDRFRNDGYYLIDASGIPMPSGSSVAQKKRILRNSLPDLTKKLRKLASGNTKIVLISCRVFEACYGALREAGLNVINEGPIDFPASGRQKRFAKKLGQLLDEQLREAISALEESVKFWAPSRTNQWRRERYVADRFLRTLDISFDPSEIEQPDKDPPDATFRGAAFEIKEIQDAGRRRHQEYKKRLEAARQLERYGDLTESFSPIDVPIADVFKMVLAATAELVGKYRPEVRQELDLLFYVNLQHVWGIEDGPRPNTAKLHSEGWRSVSFLKGAGMSCVMFSRADAPDFLREREGKLLRSAESHA